MRKGFVKKLASYICVATLILGGMANTNLANVRAEEESPVGTQAKEISIDIGEITVAEGDTDTYRGWFAASEVSTPEYKYLQITYTGTGTALNETRFIYADGEGVAHNERPVWFATWQADKFVTVDDKDVPAPTSESQTVVIDLEKSGIDLSKGIQGFHIHAGLVELGTINFSDVKLQTTPEITTSDDNTPTESQQETTPQPTTPADPSTGIKLDDAASGMNKTLHIDKAPADAQDGVQWKYLGFVTFKDLATKDFKYLKLTYTGDITYLRFEFNEKATDTNQGPFWFDATQELHFVTVDGSEIPMVGNNTTITIDLEKSGIDMSKYNNGIHMHGNSTIEAAFDVTIKDAVLFGGTPTPNETTAQPTTAQPTTAQPTRKTSVKAPLRTVVKTATKKRTSKKVKLTLKKITKAKGYKVQFSKTKKFKKVLVTKYVKKYKATVTDKRLKKQKKLYVRAKAYKLNGKKKVYSKKWSVAKRVTIKK